MSRGFWLPRSPYSSDAQPPNTISEWIALLRIDPNDLDVRLQLAAALADEGLYDTALGQYRQCLLLCPQVADIRRSKRLLVIVRMKRTMLRARGVKH